MLCMRCDFSRNKKARQNKSRTYKNNVLLRLQRTAGLQADRVTTKGRLMTRTLTINERLHPIGGCVIDRSVPGAPSPPMQLYKIVKVHERHGTPGVVVKSAGIEGYYIIPNAEVSK